MGTAGRRAAAAVAPVAGRLADRVGGRVLLLAGLAVQAVGVPGVAVLPGPSSSWRTFAGPLVAIGVGMGLSIAPTTTEAMRGITPQRAGAASACSTPPARPAPHSVPR
ncbi:MFS transporter [Micromonospora sp. NPDC023633]|uniref:MFS transporter n=1 Tax=Micromonospora sp. NPDC023633 TaxID=3154320 RepID=UPI0033F91567